MITSFLDEHDGMRTRKCSAEMTYQKYQNLWNELTLQLNRIGPSKNVKDWQKVSLFFFQCMYVIYIKLLE